MSNYETLLLDKQDDLLTVTLNRPKSRHAVNELMMRELVRLTADLRADGDVKFVVITSTGPVFSAGADVFEMGEELNRGEDDLGRRMRELQALGQEMMAKLESMDQICVAALGGSSYGAGLAIAMAADFRVMADTAVMALPETDAGTFLTWGCTPRLTGVLGVAKAKEAIMLCEPMDAGTCADLGLVNWVVSQEQVMEKALSVVGSLRSKGPLAIRMAKKLINASIPSAASVMVLEPELVERLAISGQLASGFSKVAAARSGSRAVAGSST